jgi:hypothetical protein
VRNRAVLLGLLDESRSQDLRVHGESEKERRWRERDREREREKDGGRERERSENPVGQCCAQDVLVEVEPRYEPRVVFARIATFGRQGCA